MELRTVLYGAKDGDGDHVWKFCSAKSYLAASPGGEQRSRRVNMYKLKLGGTAVVRDYTGQETKT